MTKCMNCPKMPCIRFIIAVLSTSSILIFAIVMLILNTDTTLKPFYASLISACLTFWVNPPSPEITINNTNNNNNVEL